MANGTKADYGIDAPHVIRNLFLVGLGVLVLCLLVRQFTVGRVTFVLYPNLFWTAGSFALGGVLMLLYSKVIEPPFFICAAPYLAAYKDPQNRVSIPGLSFSVSIASPAPSVTDAAVVNR